MLLDKGPLPNPGGSTGHASNFIFPVDHSREMTALTADSLRQYEELGVLTTCGGIEVARTEERMEELRRRMASAAAWGVEGVRLVTPAEVKELVPFIDESVIVGGFYTESVGVVDSLRAGTLMRERAQEPGRSPCPRTPRCSASTSRAGGSRASAPTAATSRPRSWWSAAASGARASRAWPAPRSRSHPPSTR